MPCGHLFPRPLTAAPSAGKNWTRPRSGEPHLIVELRPTGFLNNRTQRFPIFLWTPSRAVADEEIQRRKSGVYAAIFNIETREEVDKHSQLSKEEDREELSVAFRLWWEKEAHFKETLQKQFQWQFETLIEKVGNCEKAWAKFDSDMDAIKKECGYFRRRSESQDELLHATEKKLDSHRGEHDTRMTELEKKIKDLENLVAKNNKEERVRATELDNRFSGMLSEADQRAKKFVSDHDIRDLRDKIKFLERCLPPSNSERAAALPVTASSSGRQSPAPRLQLRGDAQTRTTIPNGVTPQPAAMVNPVHPCPKTPPPSAATRGLSTEKEAPSDRLVRQNEVAIRGGRSTVMPVDFPRKKDDILPRVKEPARAPPSSASASSGAQSTVNSARVSEKQLAGSLPSVKEPARAPPSPASAYSAQSTISSSRVSEKEPFADSLPIGKEPPSVYSYAARSVAATGSTESTVLSEAAQQPHASQAFDDTLARAATSGQAPHFAIGSRGGTHRFAAEPVIAPVGSVPTSTAATPTQVAKEASTSRSLLQLGHESETIHEVPCAASAYVGIQGSTSMEAPRTPQVAQRRDDTSPLPHVSAPEEDALGVSAPSKKSAPECKTCDHVGAPSKPSGWAASEVPTASLPRQPGGFAVKRPRVPASCELEVEKIFSSWDYAASVEDRKKEHRVLVKLWHPDKLKTVQATEMTQWLTNTETKRYLGVV